MSNKNETIDRMNVKKILIFKIGAIGDVLMSTPLVREIRKAFPKAKITYAVGNYSASVLEGNKNIDHLLKFDQNMFFKKNIISALKLRNEINKQKFDIAFVLDKHWSFGLFIKMCGIPVRVGFDRNREGKYNTHNIVYQQVKHEIDYYLSLLDAINVKHSKNTQIDLPLNKKDISFADSFFKKNKLKGKVIGMLIGGGGDNPGESGAIRKWPTDKYIELIQRLAVNYKIILLGGPKDGELNKDVMKFVKNVNVVNSAGHCNIKQSATLMKKCALIITHDSGPMHMASAVNDMIISIFGPTNPKRKAPLHDKSVAIWKDQDIYEENYERYGKLPKHEKWMTKITAKEVEEIARKMIK